MNNIYIFF